VRRKVNANANFGVVPVRKALAYAAAKPTDAQHQRHPTLQILRESGVVQRLVVAQQRSIRLHKKNGTIRTFVRYILAMTEVVVMYTNNLHGEISDFIGHQNP
jgi:hypothetical protein